MTYPDPTGTDSEPDDPEPTFGELLDASDQAEARMIRWLFNERPTNDRD